METKKKSKISFYNDGLIGSKQKFTAWSIDLTKDQGKEGTLHRKNMINLMTWYMNRTVYMARARIRSSIIVYQYDYKQI